MQPALVAGPPVLLRGSDVPRNESVKRRVLAILGKTWEEMLKVKYAANGKMIRYTAKKYDTDSYNNLIMWSDAPVSAPRTYREAAGPRQRRVDGAEPVVPTSARPAIRVSGMVRLDDLIDKVMQNGTDVSELERAFGQLEAFRARLRAATEEERLANDDFRVPRGVMQVRDATGEVMDIAVLIDGCAARHMAATNIPINITGPSGELLRGATSAQVVAGIGVGDLNVHTTEGILSISGMHQVSAMQPGQIILSLYQLLLTYGVLLGLSLKRGKMALYIPTSSEHDAHRIRYELGWTGGLMSLTNVVSVTATEPGAVATMGGRNVEPGRSVHAVHAVSSAPISETAAPANAPTVANTLGSRCYERFDWVESMTLHDEANVLRAALLASLADVVMGEADDEMAPIVLPPPASASASCPASCAAPTARAVGRGRSLRRQQACPWRRQTGPTVSPCAQPKRARTVTVTNVNVCCTADTMSMPALVPAAEGLEVAMSPSSVPHTAQC
jgi:hypothetical protein